MTDIQPEVEETYGADLTHRWATQHRLPVLTSTPSWKFEAALIVPPWAEAAEPGPNTWDLYKAVWPTDQEAAVIGSYIDYRMTYYTETYAARMRKRPLDIDGSTNTVTFLKQEDGWRYTKWSFTDSLFYPAWGQPQPYEPTRAGLIALIAERMASRGSGGLYADFEEWVAARPEVWG